MGECVHPRSQMYADDRGRTRCGACGDRWSDTDQRWYPMPADDTPAKPTDNIEHCPACDAAISVTREGTRIGAPRPVVEAAYAKPRVIVVDERNGPVFRDGSNINRPPEGQEAGLRSIETADVLIRVTQDGMFVAEGVDKGWVTFITTKSERQMNAEKAAGEAEARNANRGGDLEKGTHPVTEKFAHVWDGSVESGKPVEGGLKGF